MSVEVEVRVEGIEEFEKKMNNVNVYMQRNIRRKLQDLGSEIHATARRLCPVKTGRLRDSIYTKLEDWRLKIGASMPYAAFIEFGTRYIRPFYFLTEAVNLHLPRLHAIIHEGIEWSIREASWKG